MKLRASSVIPPARQSHSEASLSRAHGGAVRRSRPRIETRCSVCVLWRVPDRHFWGRSPATSAWRCRPRSWPPTEGETLSAVIDRCPGSLGQHALSAICAPRSVWGSSWLLRRSLDCKRISHRREPPFCLSGRSVSGISYLAQARSLPLMPPVTKEPAAGSPLGCSATRSMSWLGPSPGRWWGGRPRSRRQVYQCLSSSPIFGLSAICGLNVTRHRNRSEVLSGKRRVAGALLTHGSDSPRRGDPRESPAGFERRCTSSSARCQLRSVLACEQGSRASSRSVKECALSNLSPTDTSPMLDRAARLPPWCPWIPRPTFTSISRRPAR